MVVESSTSTNNQNGSHDGVDESLALDRLLEVSTVVLRQAIELVENSLSSDEQLSAPSKYIPGSTIGKHLFYTRFLLLNPRASVHGTSIPGKHLRHARDHFVLLLDSVSSPAPHTLNYDIRLRNTPMETVRKAALDSFKEAISRLEEIVPNVALDEPITLHAVTPFPQVVQTTFGREV